MGPGCERGARYYPQAQLDPLLSEQTKRLKWEGMDAACVCLMREQRTEVGIENRGLLARVWMFDGCVCLMGKRVGFL